MALLAYGKYQSYVGILWLTLRWLITTRTPDYLYIHELSVTAQQLASVAQLVRALHQNHMAVGSMPTTAPCAAFFAGVPGQVLKCIYTHLDYKP